MSERPDFLRSVRRLCLLQACCAWLFVPAAVEGEKIKIKTLEDGTQLVYNENATQRARRTSNKLLPVPRVDLERMIDVHARRNGLSPELVQAVMQVESGYNPRALSSKGAIGLMQLMPGTARLLRVADPWDPEQNIRGGTTYLRQQIDRFGDLRLALAAYNAGPTAVARFAGVPPYTETQRYVEKVLGLYHRSGPSGDLQAYARDQARRRQEAAAKAEGQPAGKRVYMTRDANNQLVLTTRPPGSK